MRVASVRQDRGVVEGRLEGTDEEAAGETSAAVEEPVEGGPALSMSSSVRGT